MFRDGLWQVTTPYLCAGLVIQDGAVIHCAPILRKQLSYWLRKARWICP
jgi:hypothetical protein